MRGKRNAENFEELLNSPGDHRIMTDKVEDWTEEANRDLISLLRLILRSCEW